MKLIPTKDRILLKKVKQEEKKSPTGLILPDSLPKLDRYQIIEGSTDQGLIVYIEKYKGVEITDDTGETYLVVSFEDVVAYEKTDVVAE
jgi:co-chaperonin GroES (HSP10)